MIAISDTYHLSQIINEPTRITLTSSTLINVIFTNDPNRIVSSGVSHVGISDHSLVYAIRKFAIPTMNMHRYITTRSFKHFDADAFRADLTSIDWSSIDDSDSLDDMLETWVTLFSEVANAHAPMRTRRVRSKKSPWLSPEIKQLINNRNH